MPKSNFIIFNSFIFHLTLILIPYTTFSRSVLSSSSSSYVVLDVPASIQQALQVFSPESQPLWQSQQVEPSAESAEASDYFSLPLHSRSSIVNSGAHLLQLNGNYTSLVLSRLARDAARVDSIIFRQRLALSNFSRADFRPVGTEVLQPEDLQSPLTSGFKLGSGEYFTRVGVGQPVKEFYMVIDTGSDVSWLQCEPCSDCYQQTDPIFAPSGSSTYKVLTCQAQPCSSLDVSACRSGNCLYQVSYGDGSYTVGEFATETLSFGKSGSIPNVAIGCGHDNQGLFVSAAGLLGLGGGSLSIPSQIKATSFSYCLVDRDSSSSSTLEFNSARPGDSVLAPLLKNSRISTYFYVGLTGISVGGRLVSIPQSVFEINGDGSGGVIVDSGTAVTRLQSQAYESVRDSFVKLTQHLRSSSGLALFDTCYDLSSMTKVSVPTVAFHFSGGKTLPLPAKNYLVPVDNTGKFCLAFAPTRSPLSIIGNVQQQGTRVSYDLANKIVGFSTNKC